MVRVKYTKDLKMVTGNNAKTIVGQHPSKNLATNSSTEAIKTDKEEINECKTITDPGLLEVVEDDKIILS